MLVYTRSMAFFPAPMALKIYNTGTPSPRPSLFTKITSFRRRQCWNRLRTWE